MNRLKLPSLSICLFNRLYYSLTTMHDGKMVISCFDHVRNWRLVLFIRLNKTATNVENGRSKLTTVPDPDPKIRRGRSSRPLDKWRAGSPKYVFSALPVSVWFKNYTPLN